MKKLFSLILSIIISFSLCCVSAFAKVDLSKSSVFSDKLGQSFTFSSFNFSYDILFDYLFSILDEQLASAARKVEAARSYYFYCIITDLYSSGINDVFDTETFYFCDDYLEFYFNLYWDSQHGGAEGYDSRGDIFLRAAGFDESFCLRLLSFHNHAVRVSHGGLPLKESDIDKSNCFLSFKRYYNGQLARFLLANKIVGAIDPAPGKNGLEIAPAYVTSDELIEGIEKDNLMFFPKNYDAKISYRTDEFFQKRQANNPSSREYYSPFIVNNSLFVGTNNAQKTYFVYFYELDGKKCYSENVFCLYFDVTEVFDDNGNFVRYNKTLNLKLWSGIDGTEDEALVFYQGTDDISDYKYIKLHSSSTSSYLSLYCYKTLTDYLTAVNSNYKYLSKQYFDSNYTKLYSSDLIYENGFANVVSGYSNHKFSGSYDYHTTQYSERCHNNCDVGILVSDTPIEYTFRGIDTSKIGRGQIVTINGGDTIYNYTITNPETGDSSKFGDYITNNYTYITNNNGGSSSSGGSVGTVGGKVEVGGKIDVGGSVGVDVNVNVSGGGNSSLPDIGDISNNLPEAPQGFLDFLASLFSFLPAQVWSLIVGAISAAVLCRVWGR